ncbi:MAG: FAD-binding protein [Firmicutes bacterium]|nr:FAD-binding protein [Bacillota bacterium]
MDKKKVNISGLDIDVYSLNTIIVGSGCAGFNAADSLYSLGQKDIAIVTEGINMGTSRNTGSDKQTYYKLTMAGDTPDSVMDMARTLFNGGCMHGDIALIEAALSSRCFYKLVELGVPFPHNRYGEFVGYKTDHDPRQRATSAGPLTSKFMTEGLEKRVREKGISIFDGYLVIGILTHSEEANREEGRSKDIWVEKKDGDICAEKKAVGLVTLNLNDIDSPNMGFTLFNCRNIIYATGGPAGMYLTSVYPESQTGASGIAFEAGVKGVNLTESQYGLASVKFRWNLSGTYQQVLPRYVSTKPDGSDEKEFLEEYFPNPGAMLDAIFLKGYQWPFDPRKIENFGSSLIDILVYNETQIKGRKVFLDYTKNPAWGSRNGELDFSLLGEEAYKYLENSHALFGTPIQRLKKMNQPAIELYKNNGIDLENEYLEIDVCAQHNNGGLAGNIWWESNVKHFFPVGEVNGTFGVYRPGGSALNSTQVGSLRAAQYIAANYGDRPMPVEDFVNIVKGQVVERIELAHKFISNGRSGSNPNPDTNPNSDSGLDSNFGLGSNSNVMEIRKRMQERMTRYGAHIRSYKEVLKAIDESRKELDELAGNTRISSLRELAEAFKNRDIAITQYVYLNAIKEYMDKGGKSRGSYLVQDNNGKLPVETLPEIFRFLLDDGQLSGVVNEIELKMEEGCLNVISEWKPVRPIPYTDNWFENVWRDYRSKKVFERQ